MGVELREVLLDAFVAQAQGGLYARGSRGRLFLSISIIVMSPAFGMLRFMHYEAIAVHSYLGLYGVPLLLAGIMALPLHFAARHRYLLLGRVH